MISEKEVKHIAKLARLGLTEKETVKMRRELSSILDYIEKLKEVDITGVKPTSHSIEVENVMRRDYYPPTALPTQLTHPKIEIAKKLLDLMPEKKEGYLKVKSIF